MTLKFFLYRFYIPQELIIGLLGLVFFVPFLGEVRLFDWDEINFAESAREMIITGNYTTVQIDFEPFWEKPPLFFWFQVVAMKCFGLNAFAARLPNAFMGAITLITLFRIGKNLKDDNLGWFWVLAYLGSFLPHFYFKTALIDPTFNYFIFLGIWFSYRLSINQKIKYAFLAGLFIGLALLTKGPVGALLWALTVLGVWITSRFRKLFSLKHLICFGFCAFLVAATWFGLEYLQHGTWFFVQFIEYQARLFSTPDAGHQQPIYYHFLVVLIGCFPASILAIRPLFSISFGKKIQIFEPISFTYWMRCLFWVVLILFSIVSTKIVHYSSLAWFPVSYLAATHLHDYARGLIRWLRRTTWLLVMVGGVLSVLLMAVTIAGMYAFELTPYIKDPFVVGNLQAPVWWKGWEWAIGLVYLLGLLALQRGGSREKKLRLVKLLMLMTALCLFVYSVVVVPKIEQYVQGAALDFYESHREQKVYIQPLGFKSYAHLFYFGKQPCTNPKCSDEDWLLTGNIDRPVYFVVKITDAEAYRRHPNLRWLKDENGFVFFERIPTLTQK